MSSHGADLRQAATAVSNKPKYILYGAFGGFNAGDEVILRASAAGILRRDPTASFAVLPLSRNLRPGIEKAYAQWGWSTLSVTRPLELIRSLRKSCLVIAGGQLLNGRRFPRSLLALLALALLARLLSGQVFMIGVGTRLVSRHFLARTAVQAIAKLCATLTVRDASSLADLIASGVAPTDVALTADVVWSYVEGRSAPEARSGIVLALHKDPGETHLPDETIIELIDEMRLAFGDREITLVAHDCREKFDAGLLNALRPHLPPGVKAVVLQSAAETVGLYGEAALVISSRMHPLIIGLASGAAAAPILASSKVSDLASALKLKSSIQAAEPPKAIARRAAAALHDQSGRPPKDVIVALRDASENNFSLLCRSVEMSRK